MTVVGIDVGGTNTDAVALGPGGEVLASAKRPTTDDVTSGVRAALAALGSHGKDPRRIVIGTTHATNAIVQRRGLGRVGVIRLGAPSGSQIPPFSGWPADLRAAVDGGHDHLRGGHLLDGRELAPLDVPKLEKFLAAIAGNVDAVAVTGVFSPAFPEQELLVRDYVERYLGPDTPVSLSHQIGGLGLLERENATILNAALHNVVGAVAAAVEGPCYLAQNDGTVMSAGHAARFPVLTIGSGQANSVRGAAVLAGLTDAIVADVGGTTTDFCVLAGGRPRQSSVGVTIGGIRLTVPMPDVLSIAIGGGTIVRAPGLGPDSVAHAITARALVFGGDTPTLTDAAAHAGRVRIGHTAPGPDWHALLAGALPRMDEAVADAVDFMGAGRTPLPLILVGGGAGLASPPGEVIRPGHAHVAAAVGAATAEAGGSADVIVPVGSGHAQAVASAKAAAVERAVAAGADATRVRIVDVAETPLTYLSAPAVRLSIKAAGPLPG